MIQLALVCTQTGFDIAETLAIRQLGERHAEKLIEACKRFDFVMATITLDALPKNRQRKMLRDLRENQFSSVHASASIASRMGRKTGGPSARRSSRFSKKLSLNIKNPAVMPCVHTTLGQ